MRQYLHSFDTKLTKSIGRIPAGVQPYFAWLGRLTTPLLWATMFTAVHALSVTPGRLTEPVLAVILLLPVATLMKLFFRRQRPPTIYAAAMRVKSYSFPSSHAYSAALAGGYMGAEALYVGAWGLVVLFGALIFLIGVSRVHVGAHYPSDVIAGWLLGTVAALAVIGLV